MLYSVISVPLWLTPDAAGSKDSVSKLRGC